ncbi:MAG: DUF2304 family protein [Candidatus Eisenbacteria sp.]|nr:DUF2304 family protein [Candidatus Eisenbacteria bacterium]
MLRLMLVLVGVAMIVLAAAQGRAGRLSMGHAAAWFWVGLGALLLALVATLLEPVDAVLAYAGLLWAVGASIGFGMAHARAQTRLDERVKSLAQEIALLKGGAEQARGPSPGAEAAGGTDDRGRRSG